MEEKSYQLICSYVKNQYFVSTIYRKSSVMCEDLWYFETIVWKWNSETKTRGEMVDICDSGSLESVALSKHFDIVAKLIQ